MALNRYVSDPIPMPSSDDAEDAADFSRADLEFHGVDHSGSSFEARVFFNNPDADETTPRQEDSGYVGSFYIFGHGGCFGDIGHCDIPESPRDPFDRRPPHPLTPQKRTVVVTEAIKQFRETAGGDLTVTVVPVASESPIDAEDELFSFERLALITYD
jgi:tyrosinase